MSIFFWRKRSPAQVVDAGASPFDDLSEAERCDLAFALAALDDRQSRAMLERALDDPSEVVAFAAARALTSDERRADLEQFFAAHPSERVARIRQMLDLLP